MWGVGDGKKRNDVEKKKDIPKGADRSDQLKKRGVGGGGRDRALEPQNRKAVWLNRWFSKFDTNFSLSLIQIERCRQIEG